MKNEWKISHNFMNLSQNRGYLKKVRGWERKSSFSYFMEFVISSDVFEFVGLLLNSFFM